MYDKYKKERTSVPIFIWNIKVNNGCNTRDEKISYSDYLDLWIEDYKQNMKYNTVWTYKSIIEKYLKPNLGKYRLSGITSYQLNNFIIGLCNKYDYSRDYIRNILKVLKTWDDIDFENKIIKVKHNVYAKNKDNKEKRCGTDYYSHYLEEVKNKEETRKKANEFLEKTIQSDIINEIVDFIINDF